MLFSAESPSKTSLGGVVTDALFRLHQGCDSGFGKELARRLGEAGVLVFAGVLDVNGAGAQQLRAGTSEKLHILQLDVTDDRQIEAAHRYICTQVHDTGEPALGRWRGRGGSHSDRPVLLQVCGVWSTMQESSSAPWMPRSSR